MSGTPLRVRLFDIDIDNISTHEVLQKIESYIQHKNTAYIVTPNADHIIKLTSDNDFKKVYSKADLILADGMPLLWISKCIQKPIQEKISGSDLFPIVCKLSAEKGYRIFLLGGNTQQDIDYVSECLLKEFPGLKIAGSISPDFGFDKDEKKSVALCEIIHKSNADILFVGVGAPKQEKWIYNYKDIYKVPVSLGVGATFDLYSGIQKRAPLWMQKSGLEWFFRFIQEPKRLWRRYLLGNIHFIYLSVIFIFKNRK